MSDWVAETLAALTLDEKVSLVAGSDLWRTNSVDRLGIPALKVTDGPNGARGADGNHGPTSTSFPVGAAMGATWDPELIEDLGRALAHETACKGAHVLLGPTVNIPRVPIAGRNFECFSEDPVLSGTLAAAYVRGIQGEGVGACIKHFVCNDQEHERFSIDVDVDERALREIYLEPFRIAIAEAGPWAVMSAYNSINGTTASENALLDDVLRGDMGFDGLVMSDWYGTYGPGVVSSGLDLEMPGPGRWMAAAAVREALDEGRMSEEDLDRKVERVLTLLERTRAADMQAGAERAEERPEDRSLARRTATESMVLLSNNGLLPLKRAGKLAVIGELAAATPHQGGGSSQVNPHRVVSILEGLETGVGKDVEVTWAPGCVVRRTPPPLDPASLSGDGLVVEYFDSESPTGEAARTVNTTKSFLAFFGDGDEWVDHESFSLRMSGTVIARAAGNHTFSFGAAGRLRVWARGEMVVDAWAGASVHAWSVDMQEGETVDLVVEYGSTPGERWRWMGAGCVTPGPEVSVESAVAAAVEADVAIVVAGLTHEWESEGFDRPDMKLPGDQDALISAVASAQPNTAVVLVAGSPVEMPWADDVAAVLQVWFGGQEIGNALADVLFGDSDPGGRLPLTFPADSRQHPGLLNYPGEAGNVRYGEGIYVGYRGFDRLGLHPRFGFGHGLSYTTFTVEDVRCERGEVVTVEVDLVNSGERVGSEVVAVFARDLGGVDRRLVGYQKARLDPGEARTIPVAVPQERLRWWNPVEGDWKHEGGSVTFEVSGSFGVHTCMLA